MSQNRAIREFKPRPCRRHFGSKQPCHFPAHPGWAWKKKLSPWVALYLQLPWVLSTLCSASTVHPSLGRCHRASWALRVLFPGAIWEEGRNYGCQVPVSHGGPDSPDSLPLGKSMTRHQFSNTTPTLFSIAPSRHHAHRLSLGLSFCRSPSSSRRWEITSEIVYF